LKLDVNLTRNGNNNKEKNLNLIAGRKLFNLLFAVLRVATSLGIL